MQSCVLSDCWLIYRLVKGNGSGLPGGQGPSWRTPPSLGLKVNGGVSLGVRGIRMLDSAASGMAVRRL